MHTVKLKPCKQNNFILKDAYWNLQFKYIHVLEAKCIMYIGNRRDDGIPHIPTSVECTIAYILHLFDTTMPTSFVFALAHTIVNMLT